MYNHDSKASVKTANGMQPLCVRFSLGKTYVFVGYKTGIDVFALVYGMEDMIPALERVNLVLPKESLEFTYQSRTPILPSQNKDTYLYYLYKSEEKEEDKIGTGDLWDKLGLPTLKRIKEGAASIVYYVKQQRIEGKNIESRNIVTVCKTIKRRSKSS